MAYIGRDVDTISNVEKLDNITFTGTDTYALTKNSVAFTPSGANNILISIDGVVQQNNFSVSGQNIVFDLIINPKNRGKYRGTPDGDRFVYAAEKIEEMLKDIWERSNQVGLLEFREFVKD